MVKRTQTIWQIADKSSECVWPFYGVGAQRVKAYEPIKLKPSLQKLMNS